MRLIADLCSVWKLRQHAVDRFSTWIFRTSANAVHKHHRHVYRTVLPVAVHEHCEQIRDIDSRVRRGERNDRSGID